VKTLVIDIETAPNVGHVWGLWQQNIGLPQLLESGYVMCFAAKWVGQDRVMFHKGSSVPRAAHKWHEPLCPPRRRGSISTC